MDALILVDIQNDFAPSGALPVPEGDQIVPLVNRLQERFGLVVACKDWHPADHKSFASQNGKKPGDVILLNGVEQIMWPDHCVQNTVGAGFIQGLETGRIDRIVYKGCSREVDSYSAFFDNNRQAETEMKAYLQEKGVTDVYIAGLATDYCVLFSALDAVSLGFNTWVIRDATRGVELNPGDVEKAIVKMREKGVRVIDSKDIL